MWVLAPDRTGPAALIYYQGSSEPETSAFLRKTLEPSMVFWDVGAHLGEFSVLAAECIGARGEVHSFEANPAFVELLARTRQKNGLRMTRVIAAAVADREGTTEFVICRDSWFSGISGETGEPAGVLRTIRVPSVTLDGHWTQGNRPPDVVKLDVEGAELLVLRGARGLLASPPAEAPVWVVEYAPGNCARFGYHPDQLLDLLRSYGYITWWLEPDGVLVPTERPLERTWTNFVASKKTVTQLNTPR